MKITKVYNNSVVLAVDANGREAVVIGTGLGFQARHGDPIEEHLIERAFYPGPSASAERVAAIVETIPAADFEMTERIIELARASLGTYVTDGILIALADHISFALRRASQDVAPVDYPLRWEVSQLYPAEVALARAALELIEAERGVRLPSGEAIPLALHFVNAQLGAAPDMSATVEMTQVITRTLALVRERLGVEVDEESGAVARFVVHLRYLFVRQARGEAVGEESDALAAAVRDGAPEEYAVATLVAQMLGDSFGWSVGEEERMFLTLHVARLRSSSGRGGRSVEVRA